MLLVRLFVLFLVILSKNFLNKELFDFKRIHLNEEQTEFYKENTEDQKH